MNGPTWRYFAFLIIASLLLCTAAVLVAEAMSTCA